MGIRLFFIGIFISALIGAGGYIFKLQKDNTILKANAVKLESAVSEQKTLIENQKKDFEEILDATAILMVICVILLIKSNFHNSEKAEIIDKYFDLQSEYDKIYDDVQQLEVYSERLEDQIDILTGFISDEEYEIDSTTNGTEIVR